MKARKPEATVTSTNAAVPTKRQRVEQGAEDQRSERLEVSAFEQASTGQTAKPSRDSDSDKKKTKERKSKRVAEKNMKKDEQEKAKGKRARKSADEAREDEEEEEEPKRRRRLRRTGGKKARQPSGGRFQPSHERWKSTACCLRGV
jgi:hypothetical protein